MRSQNDGRRSRSRSRERSGSNRGDGKSYRDSRVYDNNDSSYHRKQEGVRDNYPSRGGDYSRDGSRGDRERGGRSHSNSNGYQDSSHHRDSHETSEPIKRRDAGDRERRGNPPRADWLCDSCGCHNFARRVECYKCGLAKTENSVEVTGNAGGYEPFADSAVFSSTPSAVLTVKGLSPFAVDEQLSDLFRQFAAVKGVFVLRDTGSGYSRGVGFVEFYSDEHATFALQNATDLMLDRNLLRVGYAKTAFVQMQLQAQQQAQLLTMAAAQWSLPAYTNAAPVYTPLSIPPPSAAKDKSPYPPSFESNGGAFIFQPQSGCFYEPVSHFYYCPKSKLYYNSVEGTYFKYDASQPLLFSKFSPPLPFESDLSLTSSATASTIDDGTLRKPVMMSLGFGKKDGKVKTKMSSKVAMDLNKWNERQKELQDDVKPAPPVEPEVVPVPVSKDDITAAEDDEDDDVGELKIPVKAAATAVGVIACLLCRRKFTSADQLRRHENESKLHAEMLAKAKEASSTYRDRASERRAIHGSADIPIVNAKPNISVVWTPLPSSEVYAAAPTQASSSSLPISSDNAGNALLKKLGWEEGEGLGRDKAGVRVPVGLEASKRDTVGLGGDDAYRMLPANSAARARYDRLTK